MNQIIATIPDKSSNLGINPNHRKENHFLYEFIGIAVTDGPDGKGAVHEAVNLRIYGTREKNYCCFWANAPALWLSGSGSAGGHGYHRPSAAAHEAIRKAGIKLSEPIDSRGDEAMKEAVEAITRALWKSAHLIHVVYAHP